MTKYPQMLKGRLSKFYMNIIVEAGRIELVYWLESELKGSG